MTPAEDEVVAALRAAGCVFAEDEARLLREAAADPGRLAELLARRVGGEPLEHLLGWVDFAGLRLRVAAGVFVPRRRSELLAREAARRLAPGETLVDLCCGSGAVAAVVERRVPDARVFAVDVDPVAVACARTNLRRPDRVLLGDLFEPLPAELRGRVAVVTANAPYVPSGSLAMLPPEARLHEPRAALDGGVDGVAVHARIAAAVGHWLRPGGVVLVETGRAQAATTADLVARAGGETFTVGMVHDDDLAATVVLGEKCPGRCALRKVVPGR